MAKDDQITLKDNLKEFLVKNFKGKTVVPIVPLEDLTSPWPEGFDKGVIEIVNLDYFSNIHLEVFFYNSMGVKSIHLHDIESKDLGKYRIRD